MQNVDEAAKPWVDIPGAPLPTTNINADPNKRNLVPAPAHLDKQKWQYGDTVIWFDGTSIYCQKKSALDGDLPKANEPWMRRIECGNSRFIQLIAVFGYEKEISDDDQEIPSSEAADAGPELNHGATADGGDTPGVVSRIRRYRASR